MKIPEEQIIDAENEAYLIAGHNAYFSNGFRSGLEFGLEKSNQREMFDKFYKWLDELSQEEYDDMSLTDKCETFFFKLVK